MGFTSYPKTIRAHFDGGGGPLASGYGGSVQIPSPSRLYGWSVTCTPWSSDPSGVTFDVSVSGLLDSRSSIVGDIPPSVYAADGATGSDMTNWTVDLDQDSFIHFDLSQVTGMVLNATLHLHTLVYPARR